MSEQFPSTQLASEILAHMDIDYSLPKKEQLRRAVAWCETYPHEDVSVASRQYKVNYQSIKSALRRKQSNQSSRQWGGQNKILQPHQERAIHQLIRSLLIYDILPTHEL